MRQNSYSKMIIILVANKSDLNIERQVGQEEGQAFAQKHDLLYFETSAKTGQGVEAVFTESASFINENIKQGEYDLRTENIGIKPGNTFKASFAEQGRIANVQTNLNAQRQKQPK